MFELFKIDLDEEVVQGCISGCETGCEEGCKASCFHSVWGPVGVKNKE